MESLAQNTQEFGSERQINRIVEGTSRFAGIALFALGLIGITYLIVISTF